MMWRYDDFYSGRAEAEAEAADEAADFESMVEPAVRTLEDIEDEDYEGYYSALSMDQVHG